MTVQKSSAWIIMEPLGTEQPVLSGDESAVRVESCLLDSAAHLSPRVSLYIISFTENLSYHQS